MAPVARADVVGGVQPAHSAEAQWAASRRPLTQRRFRLLLSAVFLVYLLYVGLAVAQYARGAGEVVGFGALGAFCAVYLVSVAHTPPMSARRFWTVVAVLFALFVVVLPFAHAPAFVMCLHITAVVVGRLGARAWPIVLALALAALLVPIAFPSWHASLGSDIATVTPVAIPILALATFGLRQLVQANDALARARAELARLSAENERSRIARDLHDLLGHSLTTITVKAGLAHRVGAVDPERALREIAEVETLARRSLGDVRAAVANYREVTLTGELATGRELLRAAGITAELPSAVDVVEPAHQELFGWVVREGLTNVVRHAHAGSVAVRLSASSVEILDDGIGPTGDIGPMGDAGAPGNGLTGLRERAAALGGVIDAGPRQPGGWRLRVSLADIEPADAA